MTDWLLRLVRWIASPDRAEWAEAMAAEAEASGAGSTSWALGCVGATLRDRLARERKFLLSILLLPIAALFFSLMLFFAIAWLWHNAGLPGLAFSAILASAPLPSAYYLGTIRSRRSALLAAPICFLLYQSIPLIIFWIQFGMSPLSWLSPDTTVYKMSPLPGYALGLSVWLVGAWWGSRRANAQA